MPKKLIKKEYRNCLECGNQKSLSIDELCSECRKLFNKRKSEFKINSLKKFL